MKRQENVFYTRHNIYNDLNNINELHEGNVLLLGDIEKKPSVPKLHI